MHKTKNKIHLLACTLIVVCLFSSCVYDAMVVAFFKNCTDDTLFIGVSHHDNIDSVNRQLECDYIKDYNSLNSCELSLWKQTERSRYINIIYPDSLCSMTGDLFEKTDTNYFFLIRYADAKKYSLDEIRDKKLFGKCIVTRDADGKFDRNIRYME